MSSIAGFDPDYTVAPGEILEECLDAYGMTQRELSYRIGISTKHINEIVKKKSPISPATALKLERVFKYPARFWDNLETGYRLDLARFEQQQQLEKQVDWVGKTPYADMVKLGWIEAKKKASEKLDQLLQFFGVSSPEQWEAVWNSHQVEFRQAKAFKANPIAVSAWLRKGEIEAESIDTPPL
jgi:addiction module HigA family antidote